MDIKIIRNEMDYHSALAHLSTLMEAAPGTPEGDELELVSLLLENYEKENFPIGLPDPIEAIKFCMEQQGLTRKDLEQYIGSQSKVSEVLNKKRPLSLAMIRALHAGLGIPAEVLLREPGGNLDAPKYDYHDYPFAEMFKRGYFKSFNGALQDAKQYAEELLEELFANFQGRVSQMVYCRNSEGQLDELAMAAWQARTLELASEQELPPYSHNNFTPEFIRDVVKLSNLSAGPVLAKELLQKRGIPLVILAHLPQTYLDGACFKSPSGRPVIGMTLRHDRLDNFWFTLAHELAHIYLHLENGDVAFFDDTEQGASRTCTPQEIEANDLAASLLIPEETWNREKHNIINKREIVAFADQLGISAAILAGRLRWEANNYNIFDELLGHKAVRKLFTNEN